MVSSRTTGRLRFLYRILALALCGTLLSACLVTPLEPMRLGGQDASQLPRPAEPLSNFNEFQLKPFELTDGVLDDADKTRVSAELEEKLKARLAPLFEHWRKVHPNDLGHRVLVIEPLLLRLRIVGATNRVFSGAYARESFIEMDLYLRDGPEGTSLGTAQIRTYSNPATGSWTLGATDRNLVNEVVEVAYRYLSHNFWPK